MTAKVNSQQLVELVCKIADTSFELRKRGANFLLPIYISGEKGVGKTELMKTVRDRLSRERGEGGEATFLYLSTQDTADLLGMPIVDPETRRTIYCAPEWFPDSTSNKCHIIVLDEANRAPLYVQQTMLPFSVSGLLHTHRLPMKSIVICLVNPVKECSV